MHCLTVNKQILIYNSVLNWYVATQKWVADLFG